MLQRKKQVSDRSVADCTWNRYFTGVHNSVLCLDYLICGIVDSDRNMVYQEKIIGCRMPAAECVISILAGRKVIAFYADSSC